MSLEVCVICDGCGKVMHGEKTGAKARAIAERDMGAKTGLPGGRDLCKDCAGDSI